VAREALTGLFIEGQVGDARGHRGLRQRWAREG
jgi:hypothetical protein